RSGKGSTATRTIRCSRRAGRSGGSRRGSGIHGPIRLRAVTSLPRRPRPWSPWPAVPGAPRSPVPPKRPRVLASSRPCLRADLVGAGGSGAVAPRQARANPDAVILKLRSVTAGSPTQPLLPVPAPQAENLHDRHDPDEVRHHRQPVPGNCPEVG